MGQLISGANLKLMMGLEATPGTALTTPGTKAKEFLVVSESYKGTQAQEDSQLLASDPNPRKPMRGKIAAAGDIKTYIGESSFGFLTLLALGGYGTVTGTGPYVHPFFLGSNDRWADFDVELPFAAGSKWKRGAGVQVNTFAFGFKADGPAEITYGLVGPKTTKEAAAYEASPTDWTGEDHFENVQLDAASHKIDGVASTKILTLDGTLNWNRYTDDYRSAQAGARNSTPRKRATLKGKVRLALEAEADWDLVLSGGTTHSLSWKYVKDADTYALFTLPEVTLTRTDPEHPDDNPLYLDCDWTASGNAGAPAFTIEIGSTVADYAL